MLNKDVFDRCNIRLEMTEECIGELNDISTRIIQSDEQREMRLKKMTRWP